MRIPTATGEAGPQLSLWARTLDSESSIQFFPSAETMPIAGSSYAPVTRCLSRAYSGQLVVTGMQIAGAGGGSRVKIDDVALSLTNLCP
jgi:hypothetical protein